MGKLVTTFILTMLINCRFVVISHKMEVVIKSLSVFTDTRSQLIPQQQSVATKRLRGVPITKDVFANSVIFKVLETVNSSTHKASRIFALTTCKVSARSAPSVPTTT